MQQGAWLHRPAVPAALVVGSTAAWCASVLLAPRPGGTPSLIWDGLVFGASQVLVIVILVQRASADPARREAWILLALGTAANVAGELTATFHDRVAAPPPVPAASDLAFLAGYALYAIALMKMVVPRGARIRGGWLDGLVIGLASAAALCAAWRPDTLVSPPAAPQAAVGLLYVALDVGLLVILVAAMIANRFHLSPSGTMLWVGILVWAIGDVLLLNQLAAGTYMWPDPVDLAWPVGLALLGLAGVLANGPGTSFQVRRWVSRVPAASALLAGGILVLGLVAPLPRLATALATLALILAVARQFLTLAELDRAAIVHDEARTDDLTGLLNRRGIYEELAARLDAGPERVSLLMIDLDGFKDINDSLGHQAGDEMLIAVADRFRRASPPGSDVARLGGDEFAIALGPEHDPTAVAEALLAGIRDPARVRDIAVRVQASIGISHYPEHAGDLDELVRTADVAMYMAKRDRSVICQYRAELDPHSREQLQLLSELRNAVPAGQLEVVYQPQCRLSDGEVSSVEALLRWSHPTRGQLMPAMFIEQAESSGIICDLTNFVLDRALCDLRSWLDAGVDLNLSVNISGVDLARLDLPDVVSRALERTEVNPERLTLELTETVMTSDAALAKRLVARLQSRGIRISMDDFGIGFSSLSQALSLPLDEIKLDRSLVASAGEPKGRAILRTAVRLARAVGASVVAEGVEDLRTLNFLRSIGADYAQGFLIARPMSFEQVRDCARTVPAAMAASLRVVSQPRGGRLSGHAAAEGPPFKPAPVTPPAPRPQLPGPGLGQKDTTGGADWPSGAW